ncbi:MAG: hypothetical protein R2798_09365 [Chitinophagales bacterium]|nr:hypothetical protein [Bacteroidota bacterium]MCB9043385.1 hypothetical protein [Chitinophagales bacterium]
MIQPKLLLLLSFFVVSILHAQELPIGSWKYYLPQGQTSSIAQTNDARIFCGVENAMIFSYNLQNNEQRVYTKIDGLSDVGVKTIAWSDSTKTLVVVYQDANIDLITSSGVKNITDIKEKIIPGDKNIYQVVCVDEKAYMATGFGVVIIDLNNGFVLETYTNQYNGANIPVLQLAFDAQNIYTATRQGIFFASKDNPFLFNPATWTRFDESNGLPQATYRNIFSSQGKIYATTDTQVFQLQDDLDVWLPIVQETDDWLIEGADATPNGFVLCEWQETLDGDVTDTRMRFFENNEMARMLQNTQYLPRPKQVLQQNDGIVWAADYWLGLCKIELNDEVSIFTPSSITTSSVRQTAMQNGNLWLAPARIGSAWAPPGDKSGFFVLDKYDHWQNFNNYNTPTIQTAGMEDFASVAAAPDGKTVVVGSYGGGVLEIKDNTEMTLYNESNSSLQSATGQQGSVRANALQYDRYGNLWVLNYGASKPISVKTSSGDWYAFESGFNFSENTFTYLAVDNLGNVWASVRNEGIVVFNAQNTFEDTSDDTYKKYTALEESGNLPSSDVLSIAVDLDNEIWVGTSDGIGVIYCAFDAFNESCRAEKPIIEINGKAGLLLSGQSVQAIAIDGANRKWIGTKTGIYVISPQGRSQIAVFNTENSPLPSNDIVSLSFDHTNGELYVGTSVGLLAYKTEAIEANIVLEKARIFPNPVNENYNGPIAIEGLAENANVKITDLAGNIVQETTALGGRAIWYGTDSGGNRVPTGVYIVLAASADGSNTSLGKIFIVNK